MLDCEDDTPVRLAEPSDEDDVLANVQRMQGDREWALCDAAGTPLPFCAPKARLMIRRALIRQHNDPDILPAWVGVIGEPGCLQASIYVSAESAWCSQSPSHLVELWNYVLPEYRQSDNNRRLVAFAKSIADVMHLQLISLTHSGTAKRRFYEREYGAPVGAMFRYNATMPAIGA